MNIKKKYFELRNIIRIFIDNARKFSVGVAFAHIIRDNHKLSQKYSQVYLRLIRMYANKFSKPIIKSELNRQHDNSKYSSDFQVWVIWWQGIEAMPPIVHACYDQLKSLSGDRLNLITKDNYRDYVELPEIIEEKFANGIISLTHLSDILRCKLLKKYGGLYVDATLYVADINFLEDYNFYTVHSPHDFPGFISDGRWSGWGMFCRNTNSILFCLLDELLYKYWCTHDELVDYLLIDYLFNSIYEMCPSVKSQIDSAPTTHGCYRLVEIMNSCFTQEEFQKIIKECPWQKLTYKKTYTKTDESGMKTFYAELIENENS